MTAPAYLIDGIKLAVAIDICGLFAAAVTIFALALCGAAHDADEMAERMAAEHGLLDSRPLGTAETGNGGETSAPPGDAA